MSENDERQMAEAADQVQALMEEAGLSSSPGYQRHRKHWLDRLEEEGRGLMLGTITDEKERERAVGRCQAFTEVLEREKQVQQAYQEYLAEQDAEREGKLEGGDYGVAYEAAQ